MQPYLKKSALFLSLSLFLIPSFSQDSNVKPSNVVSISKSRLDLKKDQKSDFFTVINKSDNEVFGFNVQIVKWSQVDGKDILESSNNVLVAPKTFVIKPKEHKNIRFVASDYKKAQEDYSYRIILSQITREKIEEESSGKPSSKLKIKLSMTIPIFFYSEPFKEHDSLNVSAKLDKANNSIIISNNDNQYFFLKDIKINNTNYQYNWYVLPHKQVQYKLDNNLLPDSSSAIELTTDRMTLLK
jgi:hypothetical protein